MNPKTRRTLLKGSVAAAGAVAIGLAPRWLFRRDRRAASNVVLIVVDALRADRLGCYGYMRALGGVEGGGARVRSITPQIDRFAERGALFETCISQSNWTPVSVFSMLYGVNPRNPTGDDDPLGHGFLDPWTKNLYPSKSLLYTLNRARNEGLTWDTRAILTNPFLKTTRFHAIFEDVSLPTPDFPPPRIYPDARQVNREVADEIASFKRTARRGDDDECLFLYAHYMDIHGPDRVPKSYYDGLATEYMDNEDDAAIHALRSRKGKYLAEDAAALARLGDNYDARLVYTDEALGELFRTIEAELGMENTLVILASDHGESLGERGFVGHGFSMYQQEIHVPLIIAGGAMAPGVRVRSTVRNVDVLQTVGVHFGFNPKNDGASLFPLVGEAAEGRATAAREAFSWSACGQHLDGKQTGAVLSPSYVKYIVLEGADGQIEAEELYNLRVDATEGNDLSGSQGDLLAAMRTRYLELRSAGVKRPAASATDAGNRAMEESLRGLGYLQ